MIKRPLFFVMMCFGFFILIQSLVPKVMAMKNSNVDEYMLEDQSSRKRKNYVLRLARDSEILGNSGNLGTNYDTDYIQPDPANPEELSAFIVDYANMIRNDVVLLDKSVETRTRKRGNMKVKKHHDDGTANLGVNAIPSSVPTYYCSEDSCPWPYKCLNNTYNFIPIIKRRMMTKEISLFDIPKDLIRLWVGDYHPISVGCVCVRDYHGTAN